MFALGFFLASCIVRLWLLLPSNILLRWLRRPGMLYRAPLISPALAIGYAMVAWLLAWAEQDIAHWLVIPAIGCFLSTIKFTVFTPVAAVRLIVGHLRNDKARRLQATRTRELA